MESMIERRKYHGGGNRGRPNKETILRRELASLHAQGITPKRVMLELMLHHYGDYQVARREFEAQSEPKLNIIKRMDSLGYKTMQAAIAVAPYYHAKPMSTLPIEDGMVAFVIRAPNKEEDSDSWVDKYRPKVIDATPTK